MTFGGVDLLEPQPGESRPASSALSGASSPLASRQCGLGHQVLAVAYLPTRGLPASAGVHLHAESCPHPRRQAAAQHSLLRRQLQWVSIDLLVVVVAALQPWRGRMRLQGLLSSVVLVTLTPLPRLPFLFSQLQDRKRPQCLHLPHPPSRLRPVVRAAVRREVLLLVP